ncbi:MAG: MFS transporter [Actinobacteria bacterium]|nr:MAG: MFS transporter [Actinomycetota bacterium]
MAKVELRGLFRERLFRRLLAVRVVGQLQDGIIQSALAGFVLFSPESQDSPAGVVGAFAILLLPYSIIGPFMGVFLDRWRRRQVLLVANLVRSVLVVGLIAATLGSWPVWATGLLVLFVLGLNRLILTALAASLPRTVSVDHLVPANAVAPVSGTVGAAVGGALAIGAGAMLGATRATTAALLAIAAVGLLVTAALSLRIPIGALGPEGERQRETVGEVVRQLAAGARDLLDARPAWWSAWGVMAHRAAYGIALLLAIVASKSVLSPDSNAGALGVVGIAIGAAGAGALLGAIITPPIVRASSPGVWSAAVAAIAAVAATIGLLSVSTLGFVVGGFVLGLAGQAIKIDTDTVIALTIGDDARGRVFSLLDVGINVALLCGIAVAGLLIGPGGTSTGLALATGTLLTLSAGLFVLSGRRRRTEQSQRMDDRASTEHGWLQTPVEADQAAGDHERSE